MRRQLLNQLLAVPPVILFIYLAVSVELQRNFRTDMLQTFDGKQGVFLRCYTGWNAYAKLPLLFAQSFKSSLSLPGQIICNNKLSFISKSRFYLFPFLSIRYVPYHLIVDLQQSGYSQKQLFFALLYVNGAVGQHAPWCYNHPLKFQQLCCQQGQQGKQRGVYAVDVNHFAPAFFDQSFPQADRGRSGTAIPDLHALG